MKLMITGPARSGTTALCKLLNSDSQFIIGNEMGFYSWWDRPGSVRMKAILRHDGVFDKVMREKNPGLSFSRLKEIMTGVPTGFVAAETMRQLAKAKYVGDKYPCYVSTLIPIMEKHPSLKVILAIRDPRAIIASHLRGAQIGWKRDNVADSAHWTKETEIMLKKLDTTHAHLWDRIHVVIYEWAVQNPMGLVSDLGEFLGVCTNFTNIAEYSATNVDTWRKELSDGWESEVPKEVFDYMRRFNYM